MPPLPTLLPSGPRVFPRIKFVWGTAEVIHGRWWLGLFCSYERRPGFPGTGLAISGRGFLRWTLVLGVAGYLAGAAAMARWLARNPYNQIGFTDVLTWPARRESMAKLRGRAWLAQGKDALKAKRWAEGLFLLRKGLDLCPEDFDARLMLAQFHLLAGQRAQAFTLLVEGARERLPPADWREQFFALVSAGEEWESALQFSERCLSQLAGRAPALEREQLLAHQCTALLGLARAAEVLARTEAEGDAAGAVIKIQRARALLALGRADDAVELLVRWRAAAGSGRKWEFIPWQVWALRETKRFAEMEQALAELRELQPTQPEPLALAVVERARAGRGATAALDDYIFRFGNTPANLLLVAQPLAEIPDVAMLQRVTTAAVERGFAPRPFQVHLATALLESGDWPALARFVVELAPAFAGADAEARLWFDWIECLSTALSSPSPAATDRLTAFLQRRLVSLEAHRSTLVALRRAGRDEAARNVLAVSRRHYAESPSLRRLQAEVDASLAAAPPPAKPTLVAVAAPVPADWREYFGELDAAIAQPDWLAADRLVKNVRRARPAPEWLVAHDGELQSRELRVTQGRHDTPALRLTARLYLNGAAGREDDVVAFARALHASGETDDALVLVRTVLETPSDHPVAQSLLAEWRPPKAPSESNPPVNPVSRQ